MSAASSRTVGSRLSDLITDTAAGPPAPVTSTRICCWPRSSRGIRYPLDEFCGLRPPVVSPAVLPVFPPVRGGRAGAVLAPHDAPGRGKLVLPGHRRLPDHL